jgi:hypothetical protein
MGNYSAEGDDGQLYGPIDEEGLIGWAREGRVAATTRIRDEGSGVIVPAAQVPALVSIFGPAIAAAPAPIYQPAQQPAYAGPQVTAPHGYPQPQGYAPQGYSQPGYIQQGSPQMVGYATPSGLGGAPSLAHQLTEFSGAAVVILHIITLGIFSFFYWPLMHGKFPKNRPDDPSAGKALGFMFIPLFNIYWFFFASLRLIDRIDEQRTARGLAPMGKGLILTTLILSCIPYFNFLVMFIMWPIVAGTTQGNINELVRVSATAQPMPVYR